MTLLVNNCLFHKEDTVMNSAFFARAAQGAISKLGSEGKVLSGNSGGDKNGSHSTDECDPAIKQSRDIASKRISYVLAGIMWCICKSFRRGKYFSDKWRV